jgi:sugar phosphate isomerase/epimerase
VKTSFYTSLFGDRTLREVADFAASAGYDAIEVDFRRHAQDPARLDAVAEAVRARGIELCAVTVFGNQLDPDQTARDTLRASTRAIVDGAKALGIPAVVLFPGRNATRPEAEDYADIAAYLMELAEAGGGTRILMENWPGATKNYVATTPAGWDRLFALVTRPEVGLEFDPSHLIWQGIDPAAAFASYVGRVGMLHAKDTEIRTADLQRQGYLGTGWWSYRLPGRGQLNWGQFLSGVAATGFDGVISVEHEDSDFGWREGPLERRREGLEIALRAIKSGWPNP